MDPKHLLNISGNCSPREIRQLFAYSEFTPDLRHLRRKDNLVADALSRIEHMTISTIADIDYEATAEAQTSQHIHETA
ncbi:unnamed protein product [Protopolystoma xenopodis]|uniref:Uncharacterized protein n=1 Tax=Protopolystoma xenopodis TaxID=117903 RepID=A0A3S5AJA4_9PLAT|nr:unnamed protein product [Protopolystoma xenopodis]